MRARTDFFTLCPSCDNEVRLTLAAWLQSGRSGYTCVCPSASCQHQWVCIQEWVSRDLVEIKPATAARPVETAAFGSSFSPAGGQPHLTPPRPRLIPTYQPMSASNTASSAMAETRQPVSAQHSGPPTTRVPAPQTSAFSQQPQSQVPAATPSGIPGQHVSIGGHQYHIQQPHVPGVAAPKSWSWERQNAPQSTENR